MSTNRKRRTQWTISVGAMLLTMAAATPSFGKGGPAVTVRAIVVRGNEVAITVANRTGETRAGVVASRVLTERGKLDIAAPYTAAPRQTVTVRIRVPERVIDEFPVGVVVDDGVPF